VKRTVDSASPAVGTDFLTRSEVSRLLGVSPNTVTLGGHHRFERELVEQLRKSLSRAGSRLD
jgi:hypothetical protein